jgi:predicted ArsR family transcriptional regulator
VLTALLQTLAERTTAEELDALLREVGRRIGPASPESGSLDSRVRAAAALLSSLGSELDIERTPEGYLLRGYACPLAAAVRGEPNACHVVEELVQAVVGQPVRVRCDRSAGARCRFQVLSAEARPAT